MTLDVTIGKLVIKTFDEVLEQKLDDEYTYNFKDTFSIIDFLSIDECPGEIDGCTNGDTMCPNRAYRSGSLSFYRFFSDVMFELDDEIRHLKSNDRQYTLIKPYLERINAIEYTGLKLHEIRLMWFKFWCNKAVELYNDNAVIMFS